MSELIMGDIKQFPTKDTPPWQKHLDGAMQQLNGPVCTLILLGVSRKMFFEMMGSCFDYWEHMRDSEPIDDDEPA